MNGSSATVYATVDVAESSGNYFISAYAATDDLPIIEQKSTSVLQKIVVPLGAEFRVRMQRGAFSGQVLPARFILTNSQVRQPLGRRYLFGDSVVIAYGSDAPVETKSFQAVHYGTGELRIAPVDSSAPTINVAVEVVSPQHLGSTQSTWHVDEHMLEAAHRSGLPPQMVKGQRRQEGSFNSDGGLSSLVYEPCRDVDTVQALMGSEPYVSFTAPDPSGDELVAEDLDGRGKYRIVVLDPNGASMRRAIQPDDVDVTIAQIFDANDCIRRDQHGRCHGANWSYTCNSRVIQQVRTATTTDAQTPTSSSYGWFQIMYYTAIADDWSVEDPPGTRRRNPHYLFDTPQNLAIGGGTLYFANDLNVKHWRRLYPGVNEAATQQSSDDFSTKLRRMYRMYNRGWSTPSNNSGPHFSDYGQAVLYYSQQFRPTRSGSILR